MKTISLIILTLLFNFSNYGQENNVKDSLSLSNGDTQSFVIRCRSTINDQLPLYIVDGVPLNSETINTFFRSIDPDDIVSISVLKDGSALFCDGDAKNGVVLITTKNYKTPIVKKKEYAFKTYEVCEDNWNTIQDVYNDIQAKVPGVSITANSNLNQFPNIRMRGDNNTIVIVDGIRYDASILNTLNPSDIESVTVAPSVAATNYFLNN